MSTKPSDCRATVRRYLDALFILRAHHAEPENQAEAGRLIRSLGDRGTNVTEELRDMIDLPPEHLTPFELRVRAIASRMTPSPTTKE